MDRVLYGTRRGERKEHLERKLSESLRKKLSNWRLTVHCYYYFHPQSPVYARSLSMYCASPFARLSLSFVRNSHNPQFLIVDRTVFGSTNVPEIQQPSFERSRGLDASKVGIRSANVLNA